jgi:hypothetical protein
MILGILVALINIAGLATGETRRDVYHGRARGALRYHEYLNGSGMRQSVFAAVALAAAFVVRLRAESTRIAVHVAGSWIAASGLLLLGWAVRRG